MTVAPTTDGLRDEGLHRAAHAPVYRAYTATTRDTLYQAGTDAEDRHALLRVLFLTGWLAEDCFADNDWFGARRVLVLSASSKTAIGFAHCADARAGIEVVGVTSSRNHAFTHALGCYDEVVTYDDVAAIPRSAPIVAIDMAGSGPVLASVHSHFGDQLRHSMAIGRSHHEAPARVPGMPGPKPEFFFAPTQVRKRVQDWGPRGYQERVVKALSEFVAWSSAGCTCSNRAAPRPRRRPGTKSMQAGSHPTLATWSRSGTELPAIELTRVTPVEPPCVRRNHLCP